MTPAPAGAARGGPGEHPGLLLLAGHLLRRVVPGVGRAHHESLLVLDLEVAVATPLLGLGDMLDTCAWLNDQ